MRYQSRIASMSTKLQQLGYDAVTLESVERNYEHVVERSHSLKHEAKETVLQLEESAQQLHQLLAGAREIQSMLCELSQETVVHDT